MNFRRWMTRSDSKQIQRYILGFLFLAENMELAFLPMEVYVYCYLLAARTFALTS